MADLGPACFLAKAAAFPPRGTVIFEDGLETGDAGCWSTVVGSPGGGGGAGCFTGEAASTDAVYSSDGRLELLRRRDVPGGSERRHHLFYFAGRPVAQLAVDGGTSTWTFLTSDHLGTPVLATDIVGNSEWAGGFEPFGSDYSGAASAEILLRFPGLWQDDVWNNATLGAEVLHARFSWLLAGDARLVASDSASYYATAAYVSQTLALPPASGPPEFSGGVIKPEPPESLRGTIADVPYAKVVCDCSGGFIWKWVSPPVGPSLGCLKNCFEAHENDHISWLKRKVPKACQGRTSGANPDLSENQRACSECSAYKVSARCLKKSLRTAQSANNAYCRLIVERELPAHQEKRKEECTKCKK